MKIAIVTSTPIFAAGVRKTVEEVEGVSEVRILPGETPEKTIPEIITYAPDILILDFNETTASIVFSCQPIHMLLMREEGPLDNLKIPFARFGCSIIRRRVGSNILSDAIRTMRQGYLYVHRDDVLAFNRVRRNVRQVKLTGREREVGLLASQGLTNRGISKQLNIHEQTVKNHLKSAMQKFDVTNRTALGNHITQCMVIPEHLSSLSN